jgi:general secretion pathway protein G
VSSIFIPCSRPARYRVQHRPAGLTLIELLLVMAMIGVLAAIGLPMYQGYQERILRSQAIQDIKILEVLIKDYAGHSGAPPLSLADIGNGGKRDPWGRPYVYVDLSDTHGKGMARKDRKLNPLNSDFDLYSLGKNGVSKQQISNKDSLDDIVRANDGAFVGLAADYGGR